MNNNVGRKWYDYNEENQKLNSDVVLSTRIRLARNCNQIKFKPRMTYADLNKLNSLAILSLENVNFGDNMLEVIHMDSLNDIEKAAMVENHVISNEFNSTSNGKILLLSKDQSVSVMVGEEDHIRLQVCMGGLKLQEAHKLADMVDDVLDAGIGFAFDEKLGYLTSCLTNVGTGMRASVMVHIPALEQNNKIKELSHTLSKFGFTIRGSYGEGSRAIGSVYQISNQITLGVTEQEILTQLEDVTQKIIESELEARKIMVKNDIALRDKILRSYGIVKNALLISSQESVKLISDLRIGITTGLITEIDTTQLLAIEHRVSTANICTGYMAAQYMGTTYTNEQLLQPSVRDSIRASIMKEIFN